MGRQLLYRRESSWWTSESFENKTSAFCDTQPWKEEKYAPLAKALRVKGYEVQMHTLIIGALRRMGSQ